MNFLRILLFNVTFEIVGVTIFIPIHSSSSFKKLLSLKECNLIWMWNHGLCCSLLLSSCSCCSSSIEHWWQTIIEKKGQSIIGFLLSTWFPLSWRGSCLSSSSHFLLKATLHFTHSTFIEQMLKCQCSITCKTLENKIVKIHFSLSAYKYIIQSRPDQSDLRVRIHLLEWKLSESQKAGKPSSLSKECVREGNFHLQESLVYQH